MFFNSKAKMVALKLSMVMFLIGCMSIAARDAGDAAMAKPAKTRRDAAKSEAKKQKTIPVLAQHKSKKGKIFLYSFDGKVYELADTNGRGKDLWRMPQGACLFFDVVMLKKKPTGGLVDIVGGWGSSPNNKEQERLEKKYRERIRKIRASRPIH